MLTPLHEPCSLNAIQTWHVDIHQDQFGGQRRHMPKSLVRVGCCANEVEEIGFFQDLSEDL